jgi:hypothetical protein
MKEDSILLEIDKLNEDLPQIRIFFTRINDDSSKNLKKAVPSQTH